MTLYQKYRRLALDGSAFGFENGSERSDYSCTPKGARVIGWEGVDGVHYCFVRGGGEMVFAVNPMNCGPYVYPVAESFEDFLRLILACGCAQAVEQIHQWDEEAFNAYLREMEPDEQRESALRRLREALGLSPMEQPFAYVKRLQASFDMSEPEDDPAPEAPKPKGLEIAVDREFSWDGEVWRVVAVYAGGSEFVIDLFARMPPEQAESFPGVTLRAALNGRELQEKWGEAGFDERDRGCVRIRAAFAYATRRRPVLRTLSLTLELNPVPVYGPRFTVTGPGQRLDVVHPISGQGHVLTVLEYEQKRLKACHDGDLEYPCCCEVLAYALSPDLPDEEFSVEDCGEGDSVRIRPDSQCDGYIGGMSSSIPILMMERGDGGAHLACSATRFEPPEQVEWRAVFQTFPRGPVTVECPIATA